MTETFENDIAAELRLLDEAAAYQQAGPNAAKPLANPYLIAPLGWIADRAAEYQALRARAAEYQRRHEPAPDSPANATARRTFAGARRN